MERCECLPLSSEVRTKSVLVRTKPFKSLTIISINQMFKELSTGTNTCSQLWQPMINGLVHDALLELRPNGNEPPPGWLPVSDASFNEYCTSVETLVAIDGCWNILRVPSSESNQHHVFCGKNHSEYVWNLLADACLWTLSSATTRIPQQPF